MGNLTFQLGDGEPIAFQLGNGKPNLLAGEWGNLTFQLWNVKLKISVGAWNGEPSLSAGEGRT